MMLTFPPSNLPKEATKWRMALEKQLSSVSDTVVKLAGSSSNASKSGNSTTGGLAKQVRDLQDALAQVEGNTNTLLALAEVEYDSFSTPTGGPTGTSGFYTSPASVTISTPTGNLDIDFGGALNSGDGYFVYSITGAVTGVIVNRTTVQADPSQRVAVSGGASFAPSGWGNASVTGLPVDEVLTVALEIYGASTFTYFFGGSIRARVAP